MEDLVSMCERRCRKACNLRSAAEDSEETCHSGSSGGRARRYRKRGSSKPAARDAGAMDTDPSPVRLWDSEGHSEGYRTAFEQPWESEETARLPTRANTAPEPSLEHDAEALERPARARTAPVARHTEPMRDSMGDTPMAEGSEAPGTAGCARSGGKHAQCHCEHVSSLIGKYPKMGIDAIVHRLHRLDNAKDGLEEDVAGILDDQSAAERDMAELRAERDRYRENLELALQKQQRVVDSLLHLVEDMSGRLKRLEERQPLTSGPELPAKPAAAELVERVKTLRSAMDKPMGGSAEAPYAPPRVDPGALPFVPMFSKSTMLGEHTAPAGSMREGHVTTDPRSLAVQMSHAAQDLPTTTTAHAVYAEEKIQSQTMQGRIMGSADGHGRGHQSGNLWVKDANTGIWTAGGASPSRIPNPMGSGPTGPHSMEERDVRGVYSHPPAKAGIRLGGVVAADVGDAIRIDDLRGIKIPYYDGNPSNLDDFILDWEDFAEMRGAPRDKWVCRTFPHRLAQDLKEELRDQIREGVIQTEQACLQWLEDEERVDAPNQKLDDLWSIPLPLQPGELRVREWNRYIRKYRRSLKLVEDWNEASEIRHLLKDVLPGHWKRRVEDEEKKRAKKRVAVRIMASEDTHAGIMEFFRRNLGEPSRMLGLKNAVYVEVFGDTMGQRLMRLNNVEWRRGEPLRMQVIFARMSLDEIMKYITVELKLNAKNEAHVQDRQGHGQRGHHEDRHHREIQEDTANSAEDGSGSGQDHWTGSREDHNEAHFFAFVPHNVRAHGQDRSRWNRPGPQKGKEPRRIGNPPLSFREYRSQHDGCWVCYGKGNNHAHDHRQCKVYEADKKAYFAAHPEMKPKEQRISDWKAKGGDGGKGQGKGQGKGGGRGYGGGPGQDRRVRSIEEVAEDILRTLEELKAQQRGGQSLSGSQQEGAAAGHV